MQTRDIGNIYWHALTYPIKPKVFVEKADTQEIDEPFRRGKGLAIRVPFTRKALVIGIWKETNYTESEALTYAINGRGLTRDEIDWESIRSMNLEKEDVQENSDRA